MKIKLKKVVKFINKSEEKHNYSFRMATYDKDYIIIKTDNIIQIESMNDEEITVAEFDAFYKTEIILFISEDDLGNKYIEVAQNAINQDDDDDEKKNIK